MHVAVTGASGRLGCALVRALLARGDTVKVLELGAGVPASLAGLDVDLVHGSVTDKRAVGTLVDGVERVYHLAAKVDLNRDRDGSVRAVNVEGTRRVAEACLARRIRMVHCSSHHALELRPLDEPFDETRPLALQHKCDYHRSKAHGEQLVHTLVREQDLDAVIISPGTLTGPWDFEPSMLGRSLLDMALGRLPVLINAVTDCADARDVASATIVAGERGRRGERYLLTGRAIGMRELATTWGEITGIKMPRTILPLWVGWCTLPFTVGSARLAKRKPLLTPNMLRASISPTHISFDKAVNELGYAPRDLRASLQDAYDFFKDQGWLTPH